MNEVLETEVPGDCSTSEGRQLQHADISELNVPDVTAAAGGSLQVLIDQLEDGASGRQSCSHDRCEPSTFEFQEPLLEVIKTIQLAQESRPDVARSSERLGAGFQKVGALADVLSGFLIEALDGHDILR